MGKRVCCLAIVFSMLFTGLVFARGSLLVDDFDKAGKPNRLGGDFGVWNKDPDDPTQGCIMSFDGDIKNGRKGFSLKLEYDVDSPNVAFCGFWSKLQKSNAKKFKNLVLYIKGDTAAGYTAQFKIELKNSKKEVGTYLLNGITNKWKKFSAPLKEFAGLNDLSSLEELVITFDDVNTTAKSGIIYIDDVSLD